MAFILILEDGTGTVAGANSYASVAEADAYHAAHLYATTWTAATPDNKAIALAMATRVLNTNMIWGGFRKGQEQPLEWPRHGVVRSDINAFAAVGMGQRLGGVWPDDAVPAILKNATAELARLLLTADRTAEDDAQGIAKLGLGQGAISIEFNPEDRRQTVPTEVARMLAPIGRLRGSSMLRRVIR